MRIRVDAYPTFMPSCEVTPVSTDACDRAWFFFVDASAGIAIQIAISTSDVSVPKWICDRVLCFEGYRETNSRAVEIIDEIPRGAIKK